MFSGILFVLCVTATALNVAWYIEDPSIAFVVSGGITAACAVLNLLFFVRDL